MRVCVARRNAEQLRLLVDQVESQGGEANAFACDARKEEEVVALFEKIERDIGEIELVVFNIGANIQYTVQETTAQKYFKVWEMACLAGFLAGREAARHMAPRNRGSIFFTGATASLRGSKGYAAFSTAKQGLRALAQSMARELGEQGIHVVHVVVDGPIDTPFVRERFPELVASRPADGLLCPDDIAETYWFIHTQKRSAWTFELDIRPWLEPITSF